jgi:L-fuconolactonase
VTVDAHHHLWDPARRDYSWMAGPWAPLGRRRYDLDNLRAEAAAAGVDRTVLVQTLPSTEETSEFLATAEASDGLIAGVVGWVDLTAADVADRVDALREAAGGSRLAGVRHQAHDEPDAGWLARPDVICGLRVLADRGLVYDLLVRPRELPATLKAVEAVDELSFVVDHGAKPEIAAAVLEPWRERLAAVAALPNVTCKLSGLVTEAAWGSWTVPDLQPYVDALVTLFGPDRLMWGSDWPVCTLAASYSQVLDAARTCLSALSPDESAAVLAGTATRVYRLA